MKLASWDGGDVWYLQVYDADTVISLDNSGFIKFDPDIEVGDKNVYNTTTSRLWSKVLLLLENDIKTSYAEMRQNGLTLDNIVECIIEEQIDKIPATYYNKDTQTKYLDFGASYLYALHGNDKEHMKLWLEERLLYLDTLWDYDGSTTDYVSIRSSADANTIIYMDIETFRTMYLKVKWRNDTTGASIQKLRVVKNGEPTRFSFECKTSTDQEIRIYGGKYIKSLGDLTNLQPTTITLIQAPKVNSLICHCEKLINTDVSSCVNLSRVDLNGCTNLGSGTATNTVLDVTNCSELQYLNVQDTALQSVELNPRGSNIKEIYLPKGVEILSLNNCPQLTTVSLQNGNSCKEMNLRNCPNIESFGDRGYDVNTGKYKYSKCQKLNGLKNLYLYNSCLNFDSIDFTKNVGLEYIEIFNMPKLKKIILGINTESTTYIEPNLGYIESCKDLKIKTTNCPKLNEFIITCSYRTSFPALSHNGGVYKEIEPYRPYDQFCVNTLDLSEIGNVEKVKLLCTCNIKNLILPTTTKEFICDSWYDIDETYNVYPTDLDKKLNHDYYDYRLDKGSSQWCVLWNYNKNIHGNYMYVTPTSISGSVIWNIYTNNTEQPETNGIWDFKGLELTDFVNYHLGIVNASANQQYQVFKKVEDYYYNIINLNLTCHTLNPRFDPLVVKSVSGEKLDYSEYMGDSFTYGFTNINEKNIKVKFLEDLPNISYNRFALMGATLPSLSWDDPFTIKYLNNIAIYSEINDIHLKEQTDYENDGIIITNPNKISTNEYSCWFNNCNLLYIKELNLIDITNMYVAFGALKEESNKGSVKKIGLLNTPLVTTIYATFEYNKTIEEITEWRIDNANLGTSVQCFNNCSIKKLKLIANCYSETGFDTGNMFINCTIDELDLSEFKLNNVLLRNMFSSKNTIKSDVKIVANNVINMSSFANSSKFLKTLDLSEVDLSNCTNINSAFQNATVENLIFCDKLSDTITSADSLFRGATINNGTIPTFNLTSNVTSIANIFNLYKGVDIPSPYIVPPLCTIVRNAFSYGKVPENFIFDMSNVNYVTYAQNIFEYSENVKNLKIIFPKYTYYETVGSEKETSMRYLIKKCNTLSKLEFDYSAFKGNLIGIHSTFSDSYIQDLEFIGIDFNLFGSKLSESNNARIYISNFTVHSKANKYNILLNNWRMTYDNYSKFIDEAIAELDCANLIIGNQFVNKELIMQNPNPEETINFTIFMSAEVSKYFYDNKTTTGTDYGLWIAALSSDETSYNGGGLGIWANESGTAVSKRLNFSRGGSNNRYIAKSIKITPNKTNVDNDQLNKWVQSGDIKITYANSTDSPKTLTLSRYTNYNNTEQLSSEQIQILTKKCIIKGWNIVFV